MDDDFTRGIGGIGETFSFEEMSGEWVGGDWVRRRLGRRRRIFMRSRPHEPGCNGKSEGSKGRPTSSLVPLMRSWGTQSDGAPIGYQAPGPTP